MHRLEESYQKKCAVLCELNSVFGRIAKRKILNILVSRVGENTADNDGDMYFINKIKRAMLMNRVIMKEDIRKMHVRLTN